MAIGDIKIHGGKRYIAAQETDTCSGCAFYQSNEEIECRAFLTEMDANCFNDSSIWLEVNENTSLEVITGEIESDAHLTEMDVNCVNDDSTRLETETTPPGVNIEQVIDILIYGNRIPADTRDEAIHFVVQRIKLMEDPEYATFIRLKQKFGDK